MAKYKIVFNRKNCIGTSACNSVDPENWEIDEDGKTTLKGSKLNEATGFYELEFPEEKLEEKMQVASVCPIEIIMIYRIEDDGTEIKHFPNY